MPNIVPKSMETPDTLYVMADEKYIGAQDIEKDIMVKSFVAFENVIDVSKNRRMLVNRTVFLIMEIDLGLPLWILLR